ncbi:MAG: GAF domain-containing protein, partial [Deltaproteobacteria bacterium]|nr:GAF domain-containing protein [Deltaproteobacteria bacterium]
MDGETATAHRSTWQIEGVSSDRLRAALTEITPKIKDRLKADRVSIFLFDRDRCELWSVVSEEKQTMCLDARLGIAGHVAMTGEVVNVADAYEHPLFYKEVDLETGYRTRTLLAVPLKNSRGEVIAVGEAVNKTDGLFSAEDAEAMESLVAPIARALEHIPPKKPDKSQEFQKPFGDEFSTQNIV